MSNEGERISELESRVKELEATVRGLTDELVDANERLRALEAHHDDHEPAGRPESDSPAPEETADANATEAGDADAAESDLDDIIVA